MAIDINFKELDINRYTEMREWCRHHYGREALWPVQLDSSNGIAFWYTRGDFPKEMFSDKRVQVGKALFTFKDKNDASFFALKWS